MDKNKDRGTMLAVVKCLWNEEWNDNLQGSGGATNCTDFVFLNLFCRLVQLVVIQDGGTVMYVLIYFMYCFEFYSLRDGGGQFYMVEQNATWKRTNSNNFLFLYFFILLKSKKKNKNLINWNLKIKMYTDMMMHNIITKI